MKELTDIAVQYATEKTNQVIIDAIAKVYADGYRDGYKNREEETPIDLHSDDTEFVDLGLPSGILWSSDYEKGEDNTIYFPYYKAEYLQLPTKEAWEELFETCRWCLNHKGFTIYGFTCIGPNGNSIYFSSSGYKEANSLCNSDCVLFWISDSDGAFEKNALFMNVNETLNTQQEIRKMFSGYKLPIRLVRTK